MDSQEALKLVSTVRHEWMNRLQMISLYAALEPDKLEGLYERYRQHAGRRECAHSVERTGDESRRHSSELGRAVDLFGIDRPRIVRRCVRGGQARPSSVRNGWTDSCDVHGRTDGARLRQRAGRRVHARGSVRTDRRMFYVSFKGGELNVCRSG